MEHGPTHSPASNHEAPQDAFDAGLDNLDNQESDELRETNQESVTDAMEDTPDADSIEDDYSSLENSPENKTDEIDEEGGQRDAAKAERERQKEREREEEERRNHFEASITLRGSQKFDQKVLEKADDVLKKGELVAAKAGDKKFELKDQFQQWRIDGTQRKLDRYKAKSDSAILGFRRRKFARKARSMERRLNGLHGFQSADRKAHAAKLDVLEQRDESGNIIVTAAKGERTLQREARAEQLQTKINRMIAAEYKFAKLGREERKNKKREMKGEGDPKKREELRQLIVASGSVEKLEAVGRKVFVDRLMNAPFVNENIRNAAMRSTQQFEDTVRKESDTSQDEYGLIG